jgi:hypothetical protein
MLTNGVWQAVGPFDGITVRYLQQNGPPDLVFVSSTRVERELAPDDPLYTWIKRDYRLAADAGGYLVYVPR